jgi:hypothetical protein
MGVKLSLQDPPFNFNSFGSGIAGLYGNSIFNFGGTTYCFPQ